MIRQASTLEIAYNTDHAPKQFPIISKIITKTLLLAFCVTLTFSVRANSPEPAWEIEETEAEVWESIQVANHANIPYGTQQWLGTKEDITLSVRTTLKIEWIPDAHSQIDIKQDDIKFVDQNGSEYLLAGKVDNTNIFEWSRPYLKHGGRVSESSTPPPTYVYRPIFRVPQTTQSGTLHLGGKSVEVTLASIEPPLRASDTLTAEILSAKLLDQVRAVADVNREKYPSVLSNPNGKILQITCNLKPQLEESPGLKRASYHIKDLTIRTDKGIVVPTCGTDIKEQIKTTIHNVGSGSTTRDYVIYYAVPAKIQSFEMLFHNDPISPPFGKISR